MVCDVVGRGHELAAVGAFLDRVESGPQALVLSGESGIGKTVLWQACTLVDRPADALVNHRHHGFAYASDPAASRGSRSRLVPYGVGEAECEPAEHSSCMPRKLARLSEIGAAQR